MTQSASQPEFQDQALRRHLIDLLREGNAHATLEEVINDLPAPLRSIKPDKLPYSIWKLLEHIRITQWDILEFSRNPAHQSPPWPDGYWPREDGPADEKAWQRCLQQIQEDKAAFITLLNDPQRDLYAPFPHGTGQTLLREALLIADHTSYHAGQIIVLRSIVGSLAKLNVALFSQRKTGINSGMYQTKRSTPTFILFILLFWRSVLVLLLKGEQSVVMHCL